MWAAASAFSSSPGGMAPMRSRSCARFLLSSSLARIAFRVHPGFVDGAHLIDRELAGGAHQVFGALQVELDRADLLGPLGCGLSSKTQQ